MKNAVWELKPMVISSLNGMSSTDIDKSLPIPYHYQLRELLRDEVASGRWEVGERLPSERELCETFNLSRTTIREAIDALVNEGLLRREKGRGTFIAEPKITQKWLEAPDSFTESMLEQGYQIETRVMNLSVTSAPYKVSRELRLRSAEPVIVLDRIRLILQEPILLVTSYIPEKYCPGLVNEDFSHQSLYQVLRDKYNIQITQAKRFMEAVAANELEADLLHVRQGAPLMLIESTAYREDGSPIEHFKARHRGDRTRFEVESFRQLIER
jgi:GntR family transcriptional regulator